MTFASILNMEDFWGKYSVFTKTSYKNKAKIGRNVSLRFYKVENNDSSFYSSVHLNQLDNSQKDHSIRHRELVRNIVWTPLHRSAVYCIGKYWHFTQQLHPLSVYIGKCTLGFRTAVRYILLNLFSLIFLKNALVNLY